MKKLHAFSFLVIVVLSVVLRLYGFTHPIADWHSWRQADTAAVARNFLQFGIDPLHPRYDDLSNIQSGADNLQGWRMVEFPLYQVVGAVLSRTSALFTLEEWLRIVTIAVSVGSGLLLGLLVYQYIDPFTGLLASLLYGILPYSVYYGRSILPDPFMVFWALFSVWLLSRGKGVGWTLLSAVAGAVALLAKPMAVFLLLPIPYILYRKHGFSIHSLVRLFVYSAISLLPLFFWRKWILQFPEGIPVSAWLYNGNGIRFKGAWFQWLFADRIGNLILGYWGLVLFGLGTAARAAVKEGWLFRLYGLGVLLYFIVFATGNVQHDYYQILTLPVVAAFAAKGLSWLLRGGPGFSRFWSVSLGITCVALAVAFSWYTVRSYWWINRPEIVEAGIMADKILPKNAMVIASYNGDTTFLYQTRRQGWPLGFDIDEKIAMGATAYVTVSPTDNDGETKALASRFKVLVRNDKYAIIDLSKPIK